MRGVRRERGASMAELIECCERHKRAYYSLIHEWTQGRITRYNYDSLWATLKLASQSCSGTNTVEFDADIEAFAL